MIVDRCPSCLKPGHGEFCNACAKKLFGGKRVIPILPFSRPEYDKHRREHGGRISVSGVQSKYSLRLIDTTLELTEHAGEYILKPFVPGEFENMEAMPANEHVTMQIARRIFGLDVAENALVFFEGEDIPAYLTKRFDVLPDGTRVAQEDFAQVARMSEETHGKNYKYDSSYERIAGLMREHVSAYAVEVEKFFRLVTFNYLTHNGDAHLKNFSIYRDPQLDTYLMTPAYDLINTRLHLPNESPLALSLFESDYETESYKRNGFLARDDFFEFGCRIGIAPKRVSRILAGYPNNANEINEILDMSFLDDSITARYKSMVGERLDALAYSYQERRDG